MGEEKKGFWSRLVSGLSKTRDNIVSGIDSIFSGFSSIDDDFYEELEEILIMSDIGVNTTEEILDNLKEQVKENKIKEPIECKELLIKNIEEQMDLGENAYDFENEKSVILMIGVNGVGKTTLMKEIFKNNNECIEINDNIELCYLSQMQGNGLNESSTILEEFYEAGFKNYGEVRRYVSRYGFNEDVLKQNISSLSGGERNILQLAKVSSSRANMLLLDEPTSHLDTYSQMALEKGYTKL